MIELSIYNHLKEKLDVPVYMEHEKAPPNSYVMLERTGGNAQNHLKSATIAVQSYAKSLYEAAVLNEQAKIAMYDLEELDGVSGVHLNADYNFTDTETKIYRYQAVFDVNYY